MNNGKKRINDGKELRAMLELEKFSLLCIEPLEKEAGKIKNAGWACGELDVMYLIKLREYLGERKKEGTEFENLLGEFQNIIKIYQEIKDQRELASVAYNEEAVGRDRNLLMLVNKFLENYKAVHKL